MMGSPTLNAGDTTHRSFFKAGVTVCLFESWQDWLVFGVDLVGAVPLKHFGSFCLIYYCVMSCCCMESFHAVHSENSLRHDLFVDNCTVLFIFDSGQRNCGRNVQPLTRVHCVFDKWCM